MSVVHRGSTGLLTITRTAWAAASNTHRLVSHCLQPPLPARRPGLQVVGSSRCPVVDTWWQTETGNAMLIPLPCKWFQAKAGSAGVPFFGVCPVVLDPTTGNEICSECGGALGGCLGWLGSGQGAAVHLRVGCTRLARNAAVFAVCR